MKKKIQSPGKVKSSLGMVLFLVLLLSIWFLFSLKIYQFLKKQSHQHIAAHLEDSQLSLLTEFNKRFALLDGVEAFLKTEIIETSHGREEFKSFAGGIVNNVTGIRVIQIYPPKGTLYVHPVSTNEKTLGRTLSDLVNDEREEVRNDVRTAIETGKATLSGPYVLRQGGLGLVLRKAVFIDDEFWGIVVIVYDLPPILDECDLKQFSDEINMSLRDDENRSFWGDKEVWDNLPAVKKVQLLNDQWEIGAVPHVGWRNTFFSEYLLYQSFALIFITLLIIIFLIVLNQRKWLEVQVEKKTKEKDLLLREIHHRTKNSLNMIHSMLVLQGAKSGDNQQVKDLVSEMKKRIIVLSSIYQRLYNSTTIESVDAGKMIQDLSELILSESFSSPSINLQTEIDTVYLKTDMGISLGIILNELMTNSIKYAFPEREKGNVSIQFYEKDGTFFFHYKDDGKGFNSDIDLKNVKSFGLLAIQSIVESQLRGDVRINGKDGFQCTITFPEG